MRIYEHFLMPICDGAPDTKALWRPEDIEGYWKVGLQCHNKSSSVSRMGIMMHWGVANASYHGAWHSHRARLPGTPHEPFVPGDSNNSVTNIYRAFDEFQHRSNDSGDVPSVYVFTSNFWDVRRYTDHFEDVMTPKQFKEEFETNYRQVIGNLITRLDTRKNDSLVLTVAHLPGPAYSTYSLYLNQIVRQVASDFHLDIFDQERIAMNTIIDGGYLEGDGIHQKNSTNSVYGEHLMRIIAAKYDDVAFAIHTRHKVY